jgi:molybdate transport system ATP-binding protein
LLTAELQHRVGELVVDVAFSVANGACLGLVGPSGAGKTTILRLLSGTTCPGGGRITCDAEEEWFDSTRGVALSPELRRCGYVFQDYALFPHLSAWRNVAFALPGRTRGEKERRRARAHELLGRFGLAELANARPDTLSGGERQRVALARALAPQPKLLLLDEPLAALDVRARTDASRTLAATLRSLDVPAVLVTHDWEDASLLADAVAVVDRGRIIQRGSASELASMPASSFVADLAGAVVLRGVAAEAEAGSTLIELEGGGTVATTERARGQVGVCVYPWEITIRRSPHTADESAQNHLRARVVSLTSVANRVRVGLHAPQPLVAEVTGRAVEDLDLEIGAEVTAVWKATATRVTPLS